MPVKVRCPGCRKVLTAPDAARGKALKCPECETKVRVPEAEADETPPTRQAASKGKPKTVADDDDLLAKLDVSKAVDTGANMCPKCGAEIPEDGEECPKCGVDPLTGQLSKAAKRRKSFKGVDPKEFFKVVWGDSWNFTMQNFASVLQTAFYQLMFGVVSGGCQFMVGWCDRVPPKVFWGFLATLSALVYPGWIWHLQVETIKLTTVRKSSMKDVKFDMFSSIALGIKTFVWFLSHAWLPPALFCLPISLIHFAMPVSHKAWIPWVTLGLGLKHFGAVFYYWLIRLIVSLPAVLPIAIVVGLYRDELQTAINTNNFKDLGTVPLVAVSTAYVFGAFVNAFAVVYSARVNGLIAYYFRDTLELQTVVAEKAYVKKVVKVDKFGNPIKSPMAVWGPVVFAVIGIYIAGNAICYFATEGKHVLMPDSWARAMKIIPSY